MDEIDFQLSLILLDLLKSKDLMTDQEAARTEKQLLEYYHPIVTELTLLKGNSE